MCATFHRNLGHASTPNECFGCEDKVHEELSQKF
jgi:hypothetical protein